MHVRRRSALIILAVAGVAGWTSPLSAESVLYRAASAREGGIYYAGLLAGQHGVFYGATDIGGSGGCGGRGCGTLFRLAPPSPGATAWVRTMLHSFTGSDGAYPQSRLIAGKAGALYGTTTEGGAGDRGTIFQLAPSDEAATAWEQSVLHSFSAGADGSYPSGLIADTDGTLYGTTQAGGGGACGGGCGTVFKLAPPAAGGTDWTKTVLHHFRGGRDGANPFAELIAGDDGALYGTTPEGGGSGCGGVGCGVVFRLAPSAGDQTEWTTTILYRFQGGGDGAAPYAGLIADTGGALYGTTTAGGSGACGCGAVFRLAPPAGGSHAEWRETLLYSFRGDLDGSFPTTRLSTDRQGAIYGSTNEGGDPSCLDDGFGCGTVFKLTPRADNAPWTESVLHRFTGGGDGAFPSELLVSDQDDALFGATALGGARGGCAGYGCGAVFMINPRP
jgi:uncharacterized repeat protein (TIGR03803 family)